MSKSLKQCLKAYADVVRGQQNLDGMHEPTPTEFFAAISATIGQAASSQEPQFLIDSLRILEAVSTEAARAVVHRQFRSLSATYLQIISLGTDNASLLKAVLSALGSLLYVQAVDDGFWNSVQALQCINTLLSFLEDANMKLRKVCVDQLLRILSLHKEHGTKGLRGYVGSYVRGVLKGCNRSDYKRSLYVVLFLESAAPLLLEDANHSVDLFRALLGVHSAGQPVLTAASMRMIDGFFQSQQYSLREQETIACLNLIAAGSLETSDMESNTYHCLSLGSGYIRMHRQLTALGKVGATAICGGDENLPSRLFSNICAVLTQNCESAFVQVHDAVGTTLKRVAAECMDQATVQQAVNVCLMKQQRNRHKRKYESNVNENEAPASVVVLITSTLQNLLQNRYLRSWDHVITIQRTLLERLKAAGATIEAKLGMTGQDICTIICSSLITKVVSLYEAVEQGEVKVPAQTHTEMTELMGTIVRCIGFSQFITLVPFVSEGVPIYIGIEDKREWMLHILHSSLRLGPASLCDFSCILSTISTCQDVLRNPSRENLSTGQIYKTKTRILQLWSLFPDFCFYGPSDLQRFFPRLLPDLENALKSGNNGLEGSKEIVGHVINGLTNLAQGALSRASGGMVEVGGAYSKINVESIVKTPEVETLGEQANTVLPGILMYLEGCGYTDHTFAMAVRCVNAWAGVSPPALVTAVAKKLLQLLLKSTSNKGVTQDQEEATSGWISILMAIIPYLPTQMVHILYKTVKPMLSVNESVSSQKRAYSILDEVLKIHGEVLYKNESAASILAVVCDSLMTCHVSARNMRLRCMETLINGMAGLDGDEDDSVDDSVDNGMNVGGYPRKLSPEAYKALISAVDTVFTEVLLCQKDSNQKTRMQAKSIMETFVMRLEMNDIMSRLLAAAANKKKTLRSSAILAICMVLLQHRNVNNTVEHQTLTLVPKVCLMLGEDSAELSRAVLTFLRVCVSILSSKTLISILPRITAAFCTNLGSHKARFVTRCRGIMRKLLNRLGESAIRPYVPPEDIALLDYLVKQNKRQESKVMAKRRSRSHSLEDVLMDSDDEKSDAGASDADDNDKNLMDVTLASSSSSKIFRAKISNGDDFRITARPKGIRADTEELSNIGTALEDQNDDSQSPTRSTAPDAAERRSKKKRKRSDSFDEDSEEDEDGSADNIKRSSQSSHSSQNARNMEVYDPDEEFRVKVRDNGVLVIEENTKPVVGLEKSASVQPKDILQSAKSSDATQKASNKKRRIKEPGEEYRSKKAGGDVWKKGMLEPHAYIPLDGRMLSKRNQREAVDKFSSVVRNRNIASVRTPSHVVKGNRKQRIARRQKNSAGDVNSSNKRRRK